MKKDNNCYFKVIHIISVLLYVNFTSVYCQKKVNDNNTYSIFNDVVTIINEKQDAKTAEIQLLKIKKSKLYNSEIH